MTKSIEKKVERKPDRKQWTPFFGGRWAMQARYRGEPSILARESKTYKIASAYHITTSSAISIAISYGVAEGINYIIETFF